MPEELVGERIVCYCRKKLSERVVAYRGRHRALQIVIEGRGATRARCIVLRPWRAVPQRVLNGEA